ncbi:MAG: GatB/YqeY domain-containing protein [Deltaproteobacteria bacterium]|nr:MAG: GatB/YqeY domain-containing protein [Deltaproteobacteria bacterium]
MATLLDKMTDDMKAAMKARDTARVQAIRMLVSAVKNKRIELGRELTDEDIIGVLSSEAKRRREAAEQYEAGGRPELAEKERAELAVIQSYLPQPLSEEEVGQIVDEAIAATGASSPSDMGKVMGQVMPRVKGRFDGSRVKDLVLARLKKA